MSNKDFLHAVLKNKMVLYGGGGGFLVIFIIIASLFSGDLFKGFLLQPLKAPDYEKCIIRQGEKLTEIDCPELKPEELEVGSYELLVDYGNKNLANGGKSIIPIRVLNFSGKKNYVCEYQAQGYIAELYLSDVSGANEVKIGNDEIVDIRAGEKKKLRIVMVKDGVRYPYDTNVCGSGIVGRMSKNGVNLGTVAYGINGFLNQSGIDSFVINADQAYYRMEGNTMKLNEPGQYVLRFDEMGSGALGFSLECGKIDVKVQIEDLEIDTETQSLLIPAIGIDEDFVKSCQDKLYLSVRFGKDDVDARIISIKVSKVGENIVLVPNFYDFKNIYEGEAQKLGYPLSFNVKLHTKDSEEMVKTLAEFVITVFGENENVEDLESSVAPSFSKEESELDLKGVEMIEDEKVIENMVLTHSLKPTNEDLKEETLESDEVVGVAPVPTEEKIIDRSKIKIETQENIGQENGVEEKKLKIKRTGQ